MSQKVVPLTNYKGLDNVYTTFYRNMQYKVCMTNCAHIITVLNTLLYLYSLTALPDRNYRTVLLCGMVRGSPKLYWSRSIISIHGTRDIRVRFAIKMERATKYELKKVHFSAVTVPRAVCAPRGFRLVRHVTDHLFSSGRKTTNRRPHSSSQHHQVHQPRTD